MNATVPAYDLCGQHPADRVYATQAISSSLYLQGDLPPTRNQVAAVLHALADFTHTRHMLSADVASLGRDREVLGDSWAHASGLAQYFHGLGDHLADVAGSTSPSEPAVDPTTYFAAEMTDERDRRLSDAAITHMVAAWVAYADFHALDVGFGATEEMLLNFSVDLVYVGPDREAFAVEWAVCSRQAESDIGEHPPFDSIIVLDTPFGIAAVHSASSTG
jgi:hypothetical protein